MHLGIRVSLCGKLVFFVVIEVRRCLGCVGFGASRIDVRGKIANGRVLIAKRRGMAWLW